MRPLPLLCLLCVLAAADARFWFRLDAKPTCFSEEVGLHATTLAVRYKVKNKADPLEKHENEENVGSLAEANQARPFTVTVRAADTPSVDLVNKRVGDLKGTVLGKIPEFTDMVEVCVVADKTDDLAPTLLTVWIDHREKEALEAKERQAVPDRETKVRNTEGGPDMAIETFMEYSGQVTEVLQSKEYLKHVTQSLQHLQLMLMDIREMSRDMIRSQEAFTNMSAATAHAAWITSVFTSSIVAATYIYQYVHMKSYLMAKKLV